MKSILICLILLSGCSNAVKPKPTAFTCITPFGTTQFNSDDPNIRVTPDAVYSEDELRSIKLYRSMCMEMREK